MLPPILKLVPAQVPAFRRMAVDGQAIVDSNMATTRRSPVSFRKNALTARELAAGVTRTGRVSPSQQ
jgi:hypothetical protein